NEVCVHVCQLLVCLIEFLTRHPADIKDPARQSEILKEFGSFLVRYPEQGRDNAYGQLERKIANEVHLALVELGIYQLVGGFEDMLSLLLNARVRKRLGDKPSNTRVIRWVEKQHHAVHRGQNGLFKGPRSVQGLHVDREISSKMGIAQDLADIVVARNEP